MSHTVVLKPTGILPIPATKPLRIVAEASIPLSSRSPSPSFHRYSNGETKSRPDNDIRTGKHKVDTKIKAIMPNCGNRKQKEIT